jgi:hypothetical protein
VIKFKKKAKKTQSLRLGKPRDPGPLEKGSGTGVLLFLIFLML